MKSIDSPITGDILKDIKPSNIDDKIYEALNQFYEAFNNQDFSLMQKNWYNSNEIVMDNPLGGIKRGWSKIQKIYQNIFLGEAKVYVEFYDYTIIKMQDGFCAIGRERGHLKIKDKKLDLAIRTSRIYKLVGSEYKQVHHHGSIENPILLQKYQNLINVKK